MPTDLFELYKDFAATVNTSQNGMWRPELDFERNANKASDILWNRKIDQAEKSNEIIDSLSPFFVTENCPVKKDNSFYGIVPKPKKYGRWGSARILVAGEECLSDRNCDNELISKEEVAEEYYDNATEYNVEKLDNGRWSGAINHRRKKPTLDNPKLVQINNQFQIAPRTVSMVILSYYRKPKKATFVYTVSAPNLVNGSGDEIIYDKSKSQPLEWDDSVKEELIEILKEVYIGYTRDGEFQQIDNAQKQNP